MPDLWGDIPTADQVKTPHAILLEQAALLAKKTKGLVVGDVARKTTTSGFMSTLRLVAPALNNYIFVVLNIYHNVELFPLHLEDVANGNIREIASEADFIGALETTLTSVRVRNVLVGLLAQIQADQKIIEL
jgi:hypothetical protein